jgi:peptidylprolyl isomerase
MHDDIVRKAFPLIALLFLCGALVVAIAMWVGPDKKEDSKISDSKEELEQLPAPLAADELKAYDESMTDKGNPVAVFTTNKGVIEIELYDDVMPITAGNFAKLAEQGFYNGTKFHRVIEGFMVQGGDPNSKGDDVMKYGSGGPGYTIKDEFVAGEKLTNVRGTIAMANTGQPDSGGSQFFINLVDNVGLDYDKPPMQSSHPVFGRVVKGMDIIDAIGQVDTTPQDVPLDPIVIEKVEVRR